MLKKLKDILNTYTDEELKEIELYINSAYKIENILIDECSIDLITDTAEITVDGCLTKEAN